MGTAILPAQDCLASYKANKNRHSTGKAYHRVNSLRSENGTVHGHRILGNSPDIDRRKTDPKLKNYVASNAFTTGKCYGLWPSPSSRATVDSENISFLKRPLTTPPKFDVDGALLGDPFSSFYGQRPLYAYSSTDSSGQRFGYSLQQSVSTRHYFHDPSLSNACQEWGFFQIVNHGIPHSLIDEIKAVAKDFFNLPLEEKQKSAPRGGDPQGYGQLFVTAEDQTLDWGDLLALALMPNGIKNLALWPTIPTHFRDTVESYSIEIERVAQAVLSLFAENLHLEDADYFKNVFGSEPMNMMRMNFYPPCPRPDLVLGLSPHSDGGGITLLLQDDESVGLHVRKDNRWIPVQPIPYGLVVNIGDLVEVMTNGRYKSVEHRAVTNEERARLSIALFYNASMDAEVAPSSKLVDEHHPCLYRKFIHEEYIRYYISRQLKGKHNLADFAKLNGTNR